jgi:hypothetical protein
MVINYLFEKNYEGIGEKEMSGRFNQPQNLNKDITSLENLTYPEYKMDYSQLISELNATDHETSNLARRRYLRLIGVQIKEPFAESEGLDEPSIYTQAYRKWAWNKDKIKESKKEKPWQFRLMNELVKGDSDLEDFWRNIRSSSPKLHLEDLPRESSIAGKLFWDMRRCICESNNSLAIDSAIGKYNTPSISNEDLIALAGPMISDILVREMQYGSLLRHLAGELAVLIVVVGVDELCKWYPKDFKEKYTE